MPAKSEDEIREMLPLYMEKLPDILLALLENIAELRAGMERGIAVQREIDSWANQTHAFSPADQGDGRFLCRRCLQFPYQNRMHFISPYPDFDMTPHPLVTLPATAINACGPTGHFETKDQLIQALLILMPHAFVEQCLRCVLSREEHEQQAKMLNHDFQPASDCKRCHQYRDFDRHEEITNVSSI